MAGDRRLCSDSPGDGAAPFQDHPAWVPLFYGAERVSKTWEHDPCPGSLPQKAYASRLNGEQRDLCTPPPGARARSHL